MFFRPEFLEKYYKFWMELINLKAKVRFLEVDFTKPWWDVIWQQKWLVLIVFVSSILTNVFYTIIPLLFGAIIESMKTFNLVYIAIAAIIIHVVDYFGLHLLSIVEVQAIHSVYYGAHKFFLTVDPIYHTTQKVGRIIAKIERSARSIEFLLDTVQYEFMPDAIKVITAVVSCFYFDFALGVVALFFVAGIATFNVLMQLLSTVVFEKKMIEAEDPIKEVSTENLMQNSLIRSCFASNQINKRLHERNNDMMIVEGGSWVIFNVVDFVSVLFYFVSVFTIAYLVLNVVQAGTMSPVIGATLLITYISGTNDLTHLGKRVKYMLRFLVRVKDVFDYIKIFGRQTYPVLEGDEQIYSELEIQKPVADIEIAATNLYYDYNERAKIFEDDSMFLSVPATQTNKLYGIIGPSGTGKTTLIAILGGQLKPTWGMMTINGIDVYAIDDQKRRQIIALQGQVAGSLSGDVRDSLLLGLPQDPLPYTDEDLISVLDNVGLWDLFLSKGGLEETVGEGGMNLSGGQRQRLNFASLYLRAKFFKPLLILIDEPTSSLDEESERAITKMIDELATESVTFVIAHRIKTIEKAVSILDFTLLRDKNVTTMTFYTKEELLEKSRFYKGLVSGDITLEE